MLNSKGNGFTLIELIVVLIIGTILAQLGLVSFNRYQRRVKAFAAKTALLNIKKECESNSDLEVTEEFTTLPPADYALFSGSVGDCNGNNGLIIVRPNNPDRLPEYSYNFGERGGVFCSENSYDNFFKECRSLKDKLESNKFVIKGTYVERECSAYVLVEGPSWDDAETNAKNIGGNLLTVNNKDEHSWIANEFSKQKYSYKGDTNRGDPEKWINLWIGGETKNGEWKWTSGQEWFDGVKENDPGIGNGVGTDNINKKRDLKLLGHWNHDRNYNQWMRHGNGDGTYYWAASNGTSNQTRGIAEINKCKS